MHPGSSRIGLSLRQLLAFTIILGLAYLLVSRLLVAFWANEQRSQCLKRQHQIDKALGIWESQNVALTPGLIPFAIDFDRSGRIVRVSESLSKAAANWTSGKPPLTVGSTGIRDYLGSAWAFSCPLGEQRLPEASNEAAGDVHFRWTTSSQVVPELVGRKRGTICLQYSAKGPPGADSEVHSPWR